MIKYTPVNRKFGWADIVVMAFIVIFLYALLGVAQRWTGQFQATTVIDLSARALPKYALFSLTRASLGYILSLGFALLYGYIAAKLKRADRVMIPFLDILQSIPVFGFLPGLVISLVAIFPTSNIGLEIACVLMIATGQAWNMTFSFYYSLRSVPKDLQEATTMMGLNWFQKLIKLELPFSAVGLVWNSLMSMAGGWFFLTVCESFRLENKDFHLPGIGSYMAIAIQRGDKTAMISGVIAMCIVILFVDFVIWRPVMAWIQKFQMDNTEYQDSRGGKGFRYLFLRGRVAKGFRYLFLRGERIRKRKGFRYIFWRDGFRRFKLFWRKNSEEILNWISRLITPITVLIILWAGTRVWELIRTLSRADWFTILRGVGFTGIRVFGAVILSTLWTVPFAILVGRSSRLTKFFQPIVQVAASFPAPMLYPLLLTLLFQCGLGMNWASMFLMLFGVQWYVLFNVLAGATSISRVMSDAVTLTRASAFKRWMKLYLPSIFPFLTTGWVNAAGGAWNASLVAEYVTYNNEALFAPGIGSMIWRATNAGDFPKLAGCILAMVAVVVILNRILWNRLCMFAENKYRN